MLVPTDNALWMWTNYMYKYMRFIVVFPVIFSGKFRVRSYFEKYQNTNLPFMKTSPETWAPILGCQGRYFISDRGNIKKVLPDKTEKPVPIRIDRAGYMTVNLYENGRDFTRFIHRLVATAFVQNHQGKPFINHKNGKKLDNFAENLEWVTHAENIQHAYDNGLINKARQKRAVIDIATGKKFDSVKEAAQYYQIPYSTCKNYLNGNRPNITFLRYEEKGAA